LHALVRRDGRPRLLLLSLALVLRLRAALVHPLVVVLDEFLDLRESLTLVWMLPRILVFRLTFLAVALEVTVLFVFPLLTVVRGLL
jgi:hypothetical protein